MKTHVNGKDFHQPLPQSEKKAVHYNNCNVSPRNMLQCEARSLPGGLAGRDEYKKKAQEFRGRSMQRFQFLSN